MKTRFQYHAFASGVAGHIEGPFQEVIESQAPSALSSRGGYSSSRVENFSFQQILSFHSASTQVSGRFSAETNSWDTVMTATVEGLNIMGMVRADLIVARLASRHVVGEAEPSILPLGSAIEGLRLAGIPVDVELHTDLYAELDTHSKVVSAYQEHSGFRDTFDALNFVGKSEQLPESHRGFFPWSRVEPGVDAALSGRPVMTTLVSRLTHKSHYLPTHGHVIHLPQFGTVSLGQFMIDGKARRLTMIEVNLGCAVTGNATAADGETNGQPVPPPPKPVGN
jgi:hypothetical protein